MQTAGIAVFSAILAWIGIAQCAFAQEDGEQRRREQAGNPMNAVVKIETETAKANIICPWISRPGGGTGSGAVISGGRILTCAHCIADATFIRVRKHDEDGLYHAKVLFADHDADLALLAVEEESFMDGIAPLKIGSTPHVQDEVLAVGYPVGGNDISYTRGIVSRIEDMEYAHSLQTLLGIQVDAAINHGNSGGPVLDTTTWKIAGIAFQGRGKEEGEALGYIIPPDVIRHFLKDVKDGRVDGYSDFLFARGDLESPAKRRFCKMGEGLTGVTIDYVDPVLDGDSVRKGDVLLEIDGRRISNNGRIRLDGGEARSLFHPIYMRQLGEKVPAKVLRGGETVETSITAAKKKQRIRGWMYDKKPDYLVYGGFVFTTVSYDYIAAADPEFHDDVFREKAFDGDEPVVISCCFADKAVEGYLGCSRSLVRRVNGAKVRNLRHLAEMLDGLEGGFVTFGLDRDTEWDVEIVVDAKEMREATKRVMERNMIPADRSEDLRAPR